MCQWDILSGKRYQLVAKFVTDALLILCEIFLKGIASMNLLLVKGSVKFESHFKGAAYGYG